MRIRYWLREGTQVVEADVAPPMKISAALPGISRKQQKLRHEGNKWAKFSQMLAIVYKWSEMGPLCSNYAV